MVNKRLLKSDVILTPYEANKEFIFNITGSLPSNNCLTSSTDLTIYTGKKLSTFFDKNIELQSFGQYQRLIYDQINKVYYNSYSNNLVTSSNIDRIELSELTNKRSVDKHQSLEESQKIVKFFPTQEGDLIKVLQISPKLISNKILEKSINLVSPFYNIVDDGDGNLIDENNYLKPYVGNVFYKTANIVITNQDYVNYFPSPPTAFNKSFYFIESGSKSIDLLTCIGNGTEILDYSTVDIITGSNSFDYNISSSYLFITSSTINDYYFYFNIKDITGNCSNYGKINFQISPTCDFTVSASYTSSVATTNYIPSFNCSYDVVKLSSIDCEFINTLQLSPSVTKSSIRNNGIQDYNYIFYANQEGTWEISNNGGINYYSASFTSSVFSGSTVSSSVGYSNDFQGIVKFSYNNNFVEYYYKINPIEDNPLVFERINEYNSYLNYSSSCYPNQYGIISNGEVPLGYNITTTGDLGYFKLPNNKFSVIGTKGSFTTFVTSSDSSICSETIYINGLQHECSKNVDVYVNKTNILNNYVLLVDVENRYISTYPQWIVKSGSIEFKSVGNSLYTEIQVLDKNSPNILNFTFQDFCGTTYSKDFIFEYVNISNYTSSYGANVEPIPTTTPPTTLYYPSTTTITTTFVPKVDLRLTQVASNTSPINGEIVKLSLLVSNLGNVDATAVEVRNPLSSSMVFNQALSFGVQYTASLVSAIIPIVRINETIGVDYNVVIDGIYSSSFVNYSQIYSCNEVNTGSILGNGYINNELDESNLTFFIQPYYELELPSSSLLSYTLTNNTLTSSLPYTYYDYTGNYKTGSIYNIEGSNSIEVCVVQQSDISYGNLTIQSNGNCTPNILVSPIITNIYYSCDCGNQFFDNSQNSKGRIFVEANNPSGSQLDLEYSFLGDIDSKYQDLNFSNCLPNGLFTVWVRLKSDKTKKTSKRIVLYCGEISENCETYRILNDTTSSVNVDSINCVGENISNIITSGSFLDVCTRNRDYISLSEPLLNIQQIGTCLQDSSECNISITSIVTGSNSIQINTSSSVDLVYSLDGGWSWFENSGSFSQLSNGRYLATVAYSNNRTSCKTNSTLVNLGTTSSLEPRIDFYQVYQDVDLLCNQFQSYIYCCIKEYNTSGLYQYKIVDTINNFVVYDWSDPVTDTTTAFLVNHGTYQVLVRDVNNLYCQNMFDNLVVSFSNCL